MKSGIAAILLAAALAPFPAAADDARHGKPVQVAQAAGALSEGEVRKVDKDAKKITLRHGAIQNLDMPPMTMVFQVRDPAMLDRVKAGDKVKFSADKVNGAYTVTKIEAAN